MLHYIVEHRHTVGIARLRIAIDVCQYVIFMKVCTRVQVALVKTGIRDVVEHFSNR
jgi:hypothetical protein